MVRRLLVVSAMAAAALIVANSEYDNPDRQQIRSTSQSAVLAWMNDGPPGLYRYLGSETRAYCAVDEVARNLTYRIDPTAWAGTQVFRIDGDEAEAMVSLVIDGRKYDEKWSFVQEAGSWRVNILPSFGGCTDPDQIPSLPQTGFV